ncbi:MAG: hypothetical protein LBD99_06720 [Candidatus Margulisbacteria bacterium]|jgi:microcystin-dependent protein|nr:hypothetical protein [Candidatus Margulisiibacteriota bacterium]
MVISNHNKISAADILSLSFMPKGAILPYDGSGWEDNKTIPGWYQCNGRNGTPDLTDRFLMGSDASGMPADGEDGTNTQYLTANHLPAHEHTVSSVSINENLDERYATSWFDTNYNYGGGGNSINVSVSTRRGSTDSNYGNDVCATNTFPLGHSHTIPATVGSAGASAPVDNRPLYHSVIFVKKMF